MLGKENGTIRKSAQEKFKKRERNEKKKSVLLSSAASSVTFFTSGLANT